MLNCEIREVNDIDLEEVAGGMTCDQAHVLASAYIAISIGLYVGGRPSAGEYYRRLAEGVGQGGCW